VSGIFVQQQQGSGIFAKILRRQLLAMALLAKTDVETQEAWMRVSQVMHIGY
jgi:hypothetical protein